MFKKIFIFLLRFYQKYISPLKKPCCRFTPTCSTYAIEAIERFGALKGLYLSIKRILRCHPFCKGGYDPVPEKGE
ncbi:MAG: membrane protein insertion efficiency factor YidD [Clostridia bacterium]|nr:membrane protein insertion efficiency factor YidD [Clostridia bacterium]